jgi:hypothetical protein
MSLDLEDQDQQRPKLDKEEINRENSGKMVE